MRGKEEVVEVSTGQPAIAGRYERFNTKLGQGAFKTVWKAFDTLEQIDVAWNCIDLSCININTEREKIFKECEILGKLNHPNILKIGDKWYNDADEHLNFITNIVHDGSLSKYFRNRSINMIRIKKIAKQILSALAYLHKNGIIHRDLKGDNIFIEGNTGNVVIGDLGLSCNVISARSIVGTPHYMAPELFKEQYNEMVDLWSFGMVILELVTQQMPYTECKGAFQAYQAIISGIKPNIFSSITDNYIKYFIELCIQLNPRERPTAVELLQHPFLLDRITDRILCHNFIKSKNRKYPEPPPSPPKPSPIPYPNLDDNKPTRTRTPTPNPSTPRMSISQEKVVVEKVEISGNIYSFTMKICSNSSSEKIMTVKFEYDTTSDKPKAVADEMVKALKLENHFLDKIETAMIDAIQSSNAQMIHVIDEGIDHEDENEEKKQDEPDKFVIDCKRPEGEASLTDSVPALDEFLLNRALSRENMKLKAKQETELWLNENELSALIPTLQKEGLTIEHLRDISDDIIKEMCVQFDWNIVTRLKLQKAIKDLQPPSAQDTIKMEQNIKLEQTQVLDELNKKHQTVSRDMKQITDAINELERSAKECKNAVRHNSDQMVRLIEQDRDKLLAQIKILRDKRIKSLEQTLNILKKINNNIINTQKKCEQISQQQELIPLNRLKQIKQTIHVSQEDEKSKHKLNHKLINKSKYKLNLNFKLQRVVDTIEQCMKLKFSDTRFKLIYSNDIKTIPAAPGANLSNSSLMSSSAQDLRKLAPVQQAQMQTMSSHLVPIQSNTNLMNSTEIRAKVANVNDEKKMDMKQDDELIIDDIKLEYNENDFIQIESAEDENNNKENKQELAESNIMNQLILSHNINPASSFGKRNRRTHSAHAHSGLIQSNYSHHHMSGIKLKSRKSAEMLDDLYVHTRNNNNVHYGSSAPVMNPNRQEKKGMKRRKTEQLGRIDSEDRDELLVDGFIRRECICFNIKLPIAICVKTLQFYHLECELIKFSKIYKSTDGWRFYDGQTCIQRLKVAATLDDSGDEGNDDVDEGEDLQVYQNYKWILSDIKAINNPEIILFRIWIRNPNKGLIVIGICQQRMFKSNNEHKCMIYGIGIADNKWYPIQNNNKENDIKFNNILLNSFHQRECQIDMKLNTINGILSFYIVSNDKLEEINKENEAIITGIPSLNSNYINGFVPYFNSYQNSVGCQLKIAICPVSYYGKYRDDIFR